MPDPADPPVTETQLRAALAELNDLYDHAPCGYHSLDANGVFVRINATELAWLGYERDELVGKLRFMDLLAPASLATFQANFPVFKERGRISDLEFELVRRDGSILPVLLSATAVRDADGEFVVSRSTLMDLTARRETEAAREVARQAAIEAGRVADAANRAKTEFLSRMSHELRTPLNAILGFAQLLEMERLTDDQRENVRYISRAGRHLLELINEVLDISRIEAGQMTISTEPVAVTDLLDELVALVGPLADGRRIQIETSEAHCSTHVLADRQRLKQVLLNLLSNAVKYNREGGSIELRCREVDGRLRIAVADTGYGIHPADLERLFQPFDRLGAEQGSIEGTGMGLALSKSLMDAMGGEIGVESQVDGGSTFWVEFDIIEGPLEAFERLEPSARTARATLGAGRTILHIEDNVASLRLVERIVGRREGVELVSAIQGRIGLELAREHRPDLILLDLHLPDLPGREVLRLLKTYPETRDVPVAIVSADATGAQVARLMVDGADAYLTKPLDVGALFDLFDRHLGPEPDPGPPG